jgi:hypothetical protein
VEEQTKIIKKIKLSGDSQLDFIAIGEFRWISEEKADSLKISLINFF